MSLGSSGQLLSLGLLHMIPFHFWLKSREIHPLIHPSRVVRVKRHILYFDFGRSHGS